MSGGVLVWNELRARGIEKWNRGQLEHGGNLMRKPVLAEALSEMIDGAAYLLVLEKQHARALLNLDMLLGLNEEDISAEARRIVQNAAYLLRFGNEQGDPS